MVSCFENILALRKINIKDLPFLFHVYASTRSEEMVLAGWDTAQTKAFLHMQFNLQHTQWQQRFSQANFDIILLEGKSVGRFYVDRSKKEIHIIDIAILPEFRGQGIGSYLIEELIAEAKGKNKKLSLQVLKTNPVIGLYQRIGFRVVQEDDVYALMENVPDFSFDT
ncbi:MAG: GNAT family N-acetyltransferase [Anaerolineaceae bacterium]|nr:GNAT family N-acetyltransferase [Anaerolineaceae bacterium]